MAKNNTTYRKKDKNMQNTEIKQVKETLNKPEFIELKDLTKSDVSKLPLFNVRLRRSLNKNGLQTSVTLLIDDLTLQIPLVSSELLPNGNSRQLRYFNPDSFMALMMELNLPQVDENGKDKMEWIVPAAVRFVEGVYKDNKKYFSLHIVFKQYKYHVHFLTPHQETIIKTLSNQKRLFDRNKKPVKLEWLHKPEAIGTIEEAIEFDF